MVMNTSLVTFLKLSACLSVQAEQALDTGKPIFPPTSPRFSGDPSCTYFRFQSFQKLGCFEEKDRTNYEYVS